MKANKKGCDLLKQFIAMLCGIALAGLLAGNLAACSALPASQDVPKDVSAPQDTALSGETPSSIPEGEDAETPTERENDQPAGPETGEPAPASSSAAPSAPPSTPTDSEARRNAYAELLRTAHDQQTLPDGTELDGGDIESIEGNLFAVYDVDRDGQEELVLLWQNAYMAGMVETVYAYDDASGELREELREFPGVIFYDNGTAEAPWSHNQGLAGEFWPYNLYQYDAVTGKYKSVGSVDAWDKNLRDSRFDGSKEISFPDDTDADGNGMVYYLLPPNWDGHYTTLADDAEYLRWRNTYLKGADFLDLTFVPLTAGNIAQTLDVPYVELATTLLPNPAG